MKNLNTYFLISIVSLLSCSQERNYGEPVPQTRISRIDSMPEFPAPYKMIDWKKKAIDYDAYVFDFNPDMPAGSMIWLDNSQRNLPQVTFGLYTAINDVRQGPHNNNGEFHESLNSLAALLGAGLMGIDKTDQNGYNFVKMIQNYFNSGNGWNIMMNNTNPEVAMLGGGYGRDWWYDVLPNVLFYALSDVFPGVENADYIQRTIAEQFVRADSVLNGNYDYSYFDYSQMEGKINHIPLQQDAAGGHGYVLYSAYQKYKDERYLRHAKSAIAALNNQKESRFYEILLPMGIYTAARLNAEHGTDYDITKMLNWTFEGCKDPKGRFGWGVIVGKWGDYDVSGLQGSIVDGGGYAFLMNSMKMAWPLVPLVKYDTRFANAIGKWMLNNINASRLFFPDEIDDKNQWMPELKGYTKSLVAYEGLRREDIFGKPELKGVHPVALGDGPNWNPLNPKESMFSLYSTSPVGIMGAMVDTTDITGILRLDCNVTDFYAARPYPVYLYYNPHPEEKVVSYVPSGGKVDVFDSVSKQYLAKNIGSASGISIPAHQAVVLTELPAGTRISRKGNQLIANGHIIAYQ
ncbi:MAG: hypothetical protein BGP01_13090 [Paludibacter sp. 47-17]|jgi:hypothetical protein|nr:MAG: hypothetical protein ABS72_01200 [Paludibacter sp. SCN 50-10]OJX91339.1 MAG: hypothetical protein BGP01_13090 [Paludibacter sp. 47-17]